MVDAAASKTAYSGFDSHTSHQFKENLIMLIYLAAPYSHSDQAIVQERMKLFAKVDIQLVNDGFFTVSPLYKTLLLQQQPDLDVSWDHWQDYCKELLSKCNMLLVICMDGWQQSIGVQAEIELAKHMEIDIQYIDIIAGNLTRYPHTLAFHNN